MEELANLLYTEVLKLKRSQMFIISIIGSSTIPFFCFIAYLTAKLQRPDIPILYTDLLEQVTLFTHLLIGIPFYGILTAYLFIREYNENTLKNLIVIPISKTNILTSKILLLFFWIMLMSFNTWILTALFGFIGPFEGMTTIRIFLSFKQIMIGGILLFLLTTPVVFVSLLFKSYVSTIVFTLVITMINVLIIQSEYLVLYPWTAVHVIATNSYIARFPEMFSFISIFVTSILGIIATFLYFKREDIK